jgi:putative intracellular protease/amidase/YHS domain-containing protein
MSSVSFPAALHDPSIAPFMLGAAGKTGTAIIDVAADADANTRAGTKRNNPAKTSARICMNRKRASPMKIPCHPERRAFANPIQYAPMRPWYSRFMKRSDLLLQAAAVGIFASGLPASAEASASKSGVSIAPLTPAHDGVRVAFLISNGTVMIDFAGPWEVFQDADVAGRTEPAFNLYTVAETTQPITTSGGATIVPQYSLHTAPAPKVIVVPGQSDPTQAVKEWLVKASRRADLVMSVCVGSFVLAEAGLLNGLDATTHHASFTTLAMRYPNVTVKRGLRFVDNGHIATSAGLSASIDLALHVVARYYGKEVARQTAYDMEYQGKSWVDADNAAYRQPQLARAGDAVCPVCWMEIDPKTSPMLTYRGEKYYFCMLAHKELFASAPQRFLNA